MSVEPSPESTPPVSPSLLWPSRTAASYELKFLLNHAQAQHVESWAGTHLSLDPHANPSLGNAYLIRSIYFDTAELDVYHRSPSYTRCKFRLRRYGDDSGVFLERKSKSGDRVAKRRTKIGEDELSRLAADGAGPAAGPSERGQPQLHVAWPGYWFLRRLAAWRLQPRCVISYQRVAHVGMTERGPIRLTLDRRIECAPGHGLDFRAATPSVPILSDVVILELKFRSGLPGLFKSLVADLKLSPSPVSKYRAGIQAWGLDDLAREVG